MWQQRKSVFIAIVTALFGCILAFLAVSSPVVQAATNQILKWQQVSLAGKFVNQVEIDPGNPKVMYAALSSGNYTDAGLWKSVDSGANWTHVLNYAMLASSVDPRNSQVICAVGKGIYTSINGGVSWTQHISSGTEDYKSVLRDPTNPSIIYVTNRYGKIYKSTNNGLAWNSYTVVSNYTAPFDLAIEPTNPNTLYLISFYAAYVLKSTNGGAGWTRIETGLPVNPNVSGIDVDPKVPGHVILALSEGVYESVNWGGSWSLLGTGMPSGPGLEDILFDRGDSNIIYASAGRYCYASRDGGANWREYSLGLSGGGFYHMTPHPSAPGIVYGAGNFGVYRGSWVKVTGNTWYLAEGSTAWGFTTYITIENPNRDTVTAQITYNTAGGARKAPDVSLPPLSQTTINPETVVSNQDFSTMVTCKEGATIAVDRTMIWTGPGAPSPEAHSSVGVTAPATTWYLPEGSANWGFECWLLIQNPSGKEATVNVTYMIENEGPKTVEHSVPANSRETFKMETDIGTKDASIKIESNVPVIPERAMYRNNKREGHDSIGTTAPANDFFLAEGTTAWGFTTFVLVQNPQNSPTEVTVTYMTPSGPKQQVPFTMPANSRRTIRVNDCPDVYNTDLSTQVHGSQPIIAERAMYWGGNTPLGEACHDSIGMAAPHSTFYLPDGQDTEGRETYTLVQNPNNSSVQVEISYLTSSGQGNVVWIETIGAKSRRTFNMADKDVNGRAAIMVRSLDSGKKIMVERAMYWNDRGAGTDTIGGNSD